MDDGQSKKIICFIVNVRDILYIPSLYSIESSGHLDSENFDF